MYSLDHVSIDRVFYLLYDKIFVFCLFLIIIFNYFNNAMRLLEIVIAEII